MSHGAPAFRVTDERFRALLARSRTARRARERAGGALTAANEFVPEAPARERREGGGGRGTAALCEALLASGGAVERRFGTMVRAIGALPGRAAGAPVAWRLVDRDGGEIGVFDWLAVSGSGVAHERVDRVVWRRAAARRGRGAPRRRRARARARGDRRGDVAAGDVGAARVRRRGRGRVGRAAVGQGNACEGDGTLGYIVVQRLAPDLTAVVLHSTHEFAERRARARVRRDVDRGARRRRGERRGARARALDALLGAAAARLAPRWLAAAHVDAAAAVYGPHLHRWGNAFPGGALLAPADAFVPSARVAFLGDYVDSPRAGSVEGAALSGLAAADARARGRGARDPPPRPASPRTRPLAPTPAGHSISRAKARAERARARRCRQNGAFC